MKEATRRVRRGKAAAGGSEGPDESSARMAELPELLSRASAIVNRMLESLRAGQEALQKRAVEKLHHTNEKLLEISSATETATTDIMDGLDRAFLLIDGLDDPEVGPRGAEIGQRLRDELFGVMTNLQFQDITSQQLDHAASIIDDMEHQLNEFAALFDLETTGTAMVRITQAEPRRFDPCATTEDAERRQALVDELLTVVDR